MIFSSFYSIFSIFINPVDFRLCRQITDFSPFYVSVTFTNFKRLSSLNDTFYNSFFDYLGFKPVYVFKKNYKDSSIFNNLLFSRSAKYIFFSSDNPLQVQNFFNALFSFKSDSNASFLTLSTKFSRGTSVFEFSGKLLEPFSMMQQFSFKNFIVFNEKGFFYQNFSIYAYLLKNYRLFFFLMRIAFFRFQFFPFYLSNARTKIAN